jgi:hypothetical protein
LPDLSVREIATLVPIILFCVWIGLYPAPYLNAMEASVTNVLQIVEKGASGKRVGARPAAAALPTAASPSGPVAAAAPAPPQVSASAPPGAQPVAPNQGPSR